MRLVIENLAELDFVPIRTRPTAMRAVRLGLDFELHHSLPEGGKEVIEGRAGQWLVDGPSGFSVLTPAEFKRDYQITRPQKKKEEPRG